MTTSWDDIYSSTNTSERSWTQPVPHESLRLIDDSGLTLDDAIVDVGAGASRLVDELVDRGYRNVSVLDLSTVALDEARRRVTSEAVTWVPADVLTWNPGRSFQLWHDRAVFHFLVDDADQRAYVTQVERALAPSGHLIIGTFALDGPATCSGRPVRRFDTPSLTRVFSNAFDLVASDRDEHRTPWASVQPFTWVHLQRRLD